MNDWFETFIESGMSASRTLITFFMSESVKSDMLKESLTLNSHTTSGNNKSRIIVWVLVKKKYKMFVRTIFNLIKRPKLPCFTVLLFTHLKKKTRKKVVQRILYFFSQIPIFQPILQSTFTIFWPIWPS